MKTTKTIGIAIIVIGTACWILTADAIGQSSQPTTEPITSPATQSASQPASAPSLQQLEQARAVFRQLQGQFTTTDRSRIEKLIAQLGSDEWKERGAATELLKKESFTIVPLLRQAADGKDAEIAERARAIISDMSQYDCTNKILRQAIDTSQAAQDTGVVGDLIALLDSDDYNVRYVSGKGLLRLTGQDFGYLASAEPDQRKLSAKKAQEWWEKNKATFVLKASAGPDDEIILDLGNNVTMKLVLIPDGKFMMGSPKDELGRQDNEGPQHEVTISKPYYMGVYEVTQDQYEQIMGKNPSNFKGAQNPVDQVSWNDAVEFCKAVSKKTGKTVRLPTEAQWEYACRAGTKTRFGFGDKDEDFGDYAWYNKNNNRKTLPVGQKKPNAWGLYDMHGNVWELCLDWYDKDYYSANANDRDPQGPASASSRVLRGGSCFIGTLNGRSAYRSGIVPEDRRTSVGFRVVLDFK